MKIWPFKHPNSGPRAWIIVWLSIFSTAAMALADPTPQPIHIQADRLVTYSNSHSAEFIGHVKVTQDKTTITSDRLKVIYKGGEAAQGGMNAESIDSIEATGNVHIEMDGRIAESQQAVYTTADKKLVLSGPDTKVNLGQEQVVRGSVITFYRASGRVEIVGDKNNPVKATIRSDQRGLN
jgi:lipopolysaccharide export system protein LptA